MPNQTPNYKFSYFSGDDTYSDVLEEQRWQALDRNLSALMNLLGNGVVSGWDLTANIGNDTTATLLAGTGIVAGLAAATTTDQSISFAGRGPGVYRVIISVTNTTHYDSSVTVDVVDNNASTPSTAINIARVGVSEDDKIQSIEDLRTMIGITDAVINAVRTHVHTGENGNPPKINLESHVQGILPAEHLPSIPTSKLFGSIYSGIVKNFSHNHLLHKGRLTHAQLDTLAGSINENDFQPLGLVNAINIIQILINRIKETGNPGIQKFVANIRAIIPGITPDSWLDEVDSTATIDKAGKKIVGVPGEQVNPPMPSQFVIKTKAGPEGFNGPNVKSMNNLTIREDEVGGSVQVSLTPLYETKYYFEDGFFYVDVNAGSVVYWESVEWQEGKIGEGGRELGAENGPKVVLHAKTAIRRPVLDTGGEWFEISKSPDKSASLSNLPPNRWLRLRFTLIRGDESKASPIVKSLKLTYSIGSNNRCSFLIYPTLDRWEDDEIGRSLVLMDPATEKIRLTETERFYSEATYISQVIAPGDLFLHWHTIDMAYKKPEGTDIEVYVRSKSESFNGLDFSSGAPQWIKQELSESIRISKPYYYASSPQYRTIIKDRYLQIKIVLKSKLIQGVYQKTPEILYLGLSYFKFLYPKNQSRTDLASLSFSASSKILTANHPELEPPHPSVSPAVPIVITDSNPDSPVGKFAVRPVSFNRTTTVAHSDINYGEDYTKNSNCFIEPGELRYKVWNKSSTASGGWRENGVVSENVTDSVYRGAITLSDPSSIGYWVSPPFKAPTDKFLNWWLIEIVGVNMDRVTVEVYFTDDPGKSAWVRQIANPLTVGNSKKIILLHLNPLRRKKYIKIKLNIHPTTAF